MSTTNSASSARAGLFPAREPPAWLFAAFVIVALVVVYLPVRQAGFIWDDDAHLTGHRCIVGPLGFPEIWTTAEANYFPLVLTHLWVLHAIFGLEPLPYHVVNVLLHAANALLLWQVLRRLSVRGAWLGAALWALHPVQVESVAWISELKNTQSGVFFLLSIWFFISWLKPADTGRGARIHYGLAVACGVLAILSKPSTVMLPVALGLVVWWVRGEIRWRDLTPVAPFLLLAVVASGWTIWEQKVHQRASGTEWSLTLPERAVIAGKAIWFYLGKLLWPQSLCFIYPRWSVDVARWWSWAPLLGAVAVPLALARTPGRWARAGLLAVLYFGALLFPVLGFFDVYFFRFSYVADHFQYLASMAACALAGAAGVTLAARMPPAAGRISGAVVVTVVAGCLALVSRREVHVYRDDLTLWGTTRGRNPTAWLACNNLALEYDRVGRSAEARTHYESALALFPDDAELRTNYGNSLLREGRRDDAVRQYQAALRVRPDLPDALNALCVIENQAGRLDDAIGFGERAVRARPDAPAAHFNLANALGRAGRRAESEAAYRRAVALAPGLVEAWANLGYMLLTADEFDRAIAPLEAAARLQAGHAVLRHDLGLACWRAGRRDEAIGHLDAALQLDPANAAWRGELEAWRKQMSPAAR
ncbi:MAG: tetratricopeptide repeat protein [Verrucomicrobia bacterium]|nr:tetratricopeptide repeat protein [Verrucomicrobiota bacterium]